MTDEITDEDRDPLLDAWQEADRVYNECSRAVWRGERKDFPIEIVERLEETYRAWLESWRKPTT